MWFNYFVHRLSIFIQFLLSLKFMQKGLVKLFNKCHSRMEEIVPKSAAVRYLLQLKIFLLLMYEKYQWILANLAAAFLLHVSIFFFKKKKLMNLLQVFYKFWRSAKHISCKRICKCNQQSTIIKNCSHLIRSKQTS